MSRPRSGRGASPVAGARTPATQRGVYVQSAKSDVYVALLGVALGAMVIGCLLLLLVLRTYNFEMKVTSIGGGEKPAVSIVSNDAVARLDRVLL